MCTAVNRRGDSHLFGRTLDFETSYGEQVTVTPQGYALKFRHLPPKARHYALMGMTTTAADAPLYYDAMNEKGLCMAGLLFPHSAVYLPPVKGAENVTSFELIPYVLGQCRTVTEARALLSAVRVVDTPYSDALPATPLHWMVADGTGCLVAEPTADGLKLYDNPIEVLANEPPYPFQWQNLQNYLALSPAPPQNTLAPSLPLAAYSRGMGALGLPGDLSSTSRFVRAAYHRHHATPLPEDPDGLHQFFHILGAVSVPRGSVTVENGACSYTLYTSCCQPATGRYLVATYTHPTPVAFSFDSADIDGTELTHFPFPAAEKL